MANPDSIAACRFPSSRTMEELLELSFNSKHHPHMWRNVGIFVVCITFDVRGQFVFLSFFLVDLCTAGFCDSISRGV
jgi:hypothetical protein